MAIVGVPALAVTADEVVVALRRAGFHSRRGSGVTVLDRGYRIVIVPETEILSPEALSDILRAAGMSFLDLLDRLDAPTEPVSAAESGVRAVLDDDE